jgi:hypothetical protein
MWLQSMFGDSAAGGTATGAGGTGKLPTEAQTRQATTPIAGAAMPTDSMPVPPQTDNLNSRQLLKELLAAQ